MTLHTVRRKRVIKGRHRSKGSLRLTVRFDDIDMAWLVAEAVRTKLPAAAIVRAAVKLLRIGSARKAVRDG